MRGLFVLTRAGTRWLLLWALPAAVLAALLLLASRNGPLILPREAVPAGFTEGMDEVFTPFFHPERQPDGTVWMASTRTQDRFPRDKAPGTFRVFIVGGSVANLWKTSGDRLAEAFRAVWPDLRTEIIHCGCDGYDSSRELRVVREISRDHPDLVILMTGNNQFRQRLTRRRWLAFHLNLELRRFRPFRDWQNRIRKPVPGVGDDVPPAAERLRLFRKDVRQMMRLCLARGAAVVPVALPANVRDGAPFSPARTLSDPDMLRARLLLDRKRLGEAVTLLNALTSQPSPPALAWFWLGRAYDGLDHAIQAREAYLKALESDPWANRVGPVENHALRTLALELRADVVDLDTTFTALDARGIPGMRQFIDHCHWNSGYYRVLSSVLVRKLWENKSRYPLLADARTLPPPLAGMPPEKSAGDLVRTLARVLCTGSPDAHFQEENIALLEGLAREFPRQLDDPGLVAGALRYLAPDWNRETEDRQVAAFRIAGCYAWLRTGHRAQARAWLAKAVRQSPELKRNSSALYLRWLLAGTPQQAARWLEDLRRGGDSTLSRVCTACGRAR